MNKMTTLGLALTISWIVAFFYFAFDKTATMRPNEWGDFLAGLTAPLALLWLVLGYFQQARELRLNTEALKLQQDELQHQVEATLHLVEQTNRQAEASEQLEKLTRLEHKRENDKISREAQPSFLPINGSTNATHIFLDVINNGSDISDIEINCEHIHRMSVSPRSRWLTDERGQITVHKGDLEFQFPIAFSLSYTDKLQTRYKKMFEFISENDIKEINFNSH